MDILLYTHSDYSWVWPYWLGQTEKYHCFDDRKVIVDADPKQILSKTDFAFTDYYYYDSKKSYRDRVLQALHKMHVRNRPVLFMHEDMFLYKAPDSQKLEEFYNLVDSDKADVVKLIRAEDFLRKSDIHPNLYLNPPNLRFAIQPSIIKISKLIEVFEGCSGGSIWELESRMFTTPAIDPSKSFFCYNGESKRGTSHYDSSIYPYVATAVVKGKWNMYEYKEELTRIFNEYKQ